MFVTTGPRFGTNVFLIWIERLDQPVTNYIFSIISEGVVKLRFSRVVFEEKVDAVTLIRCWRPPSVRQIRPSGPRWHAVQSRHVGPHR
jgi:hypothetical protein